MLRQIAAVISVILLAAIGLCGCTSVNAAPKVPFIPPEYYNCTPVTPQALCDAYYSRYANLQTASLSYNGEFFVFKDLEVTSLMLKTVDQGYILAGNLIQCSCTNLNDLKHFKIGDKIDVVGIDQGAIMGVPGGLAFSDCIILPAGSLQLPAPGGGGAIIPGY